MSVDEFMLLLSALPVMDSSAPPAMDSKYRMKQELNLHRVFL